MSEILDDLLAFVRVVGQSLVGLFFMLGGAGWFVYEVLHTPVHPSHLAGAAFLSVFGAAILPSIGPAVMASLSAVIAALVQLLPFRTKAP